MRIEGQREAQEGIERLAGAVKSDDFYGDWLEPILERALRYAVSISPVLTGSYQAAHRTGIEGKAGYLFIDPEARNVIRGALVQDYAVYVEGRAQVYAKTMEHIQRLAVDKLGEAVADVNQ